MQILNDKVITDDMWAYGNTQIFLKLVKTLSYILTINYQPVFSLSLLYYSLIRSLT